MLDKGERKFVLSKRKVVSRHVENFVARSTYVILLNSIKTDWFILYSMIMRQRKLSCAKNKSERCRKGIARSFDSIFSSFLHCCLIFQFLLWYENFKASREKVSWSIQGLLSPFARGRIHLRGLYFFGMTLSYLQDQSPLTWIL